MIESRIAVHRGQSGNSLLGEPPAEGSGRIVYILPVVLGLGGLSLAISLALRWSRRPAVAGPAGMLDEDNALRSRLDDELRDLD